jgi:hypothetical protein
VIDDIPVPGSDPNRDVLAKISPNLPLPASHPPPTPDEFFEELRKILQTQESIAVRKNYATTAVIRALRRLGYEEGALLANELLRERIR